MSRALPSLGMFAGMAPSLAAPMAIATLALSTSENVQTGHLRFLHLKMSQNNLQHESCSVEQKPFKFLLKSIGKFEEKPFLHTPHSFKPVELTSKGSFLSIHPTIWHQREAQSLGRCAGTAPFLDAPLAVEPFARFASENVQIGCNNTE